MSIMTDTSPDSVSQEVSSVRAGNLTLVIHNPAADMLLRGKSNKKEQKNTAFLA